MLDFCYAESWAGGSQYVCKTHGLTANLLLGGPMYAGLLYGVVSLLWEALNR